MGVFQSQILKNIFGHLYFVHSLHGLTPVCLSLGKLVEERLAFPHRLQDLVYAAIPLKRYKQQLRPVVSYAFTVWCSVEKLSKTTHGIHNSAVMCWESLQESLVIGLVRLVVSGSFPGLAGLP